MMISWAIVLYQIFSSREREHSLDLCAVSSSIWATILSAGWCFDKFTDPCSSARPSILRDLDMDRVVRWAMRCRGGET